MTQNTPDSEDFYRLVEALREDSLSESPETSPLPITGEHLDDLPASIREIVMAGGILLPEHCDLPIPQIREDGWLEGGWRDVSIHECNEPLIEIVPNGGSYVQYSKLGIYSAYTHQDDRIDIVPFETAHPRIMGAENRLFARASVVKALHLISSYLPKGLQLVVLDAHRSPVVQEALYEVMVRRLMNERNMDEISARKEAQKFVSIPRTNPPSPHATGGAIDVAIFSHVTGGMLNFGTKFDHMEAEASLDFYEHDDSNLEAQKNRRYLYWLMRLGNFRGFPFEWWHFDHANDPIGTHIDGRPSASYGYAHRKVVPDLSILEPGDIF